jgi:hypothetical protein
MATPSPLKYYQHRYGGIYTVEVSKAKSVVDNTLWVVYNHVYPFETQAWIRPYNEWCEEGRFREISGDELYNVFQKDRKQFQEEIIAEKEASKRDK